MVASDHPGCWGAAARLPKKPGIQKLTPPSSASACFGIETTAASVMAPKTKPVLMARVRVAGCSRHKCVAAPVGFIVAPVMVARPMQWPWQRPERLAAIILHREHPDHMPMRQRLRMPILVAEKSQYRNCQQQERLAFGPRCAGGCEAEISTSISRLFELARRRCALFATNFLYETSDPAAAAVGQYHGGPGRDDARP